MRNVLVIISVFFATACLGQTKPVGSKKITMVDDVVNFEIGTFVKGTLIFRDNKKQYGKLRFNGSKVIFKDTVTQKTKRYGTDEVDGFIAWDTLQTAQKSSVITTVNKADNNRKPVVTKIDTFRVYRDSFMTKTSFGHAAAESKLVHTAIFLKLMIYGEKASLYKRVILQGGGMSGSMIPGTPVFVGYQNGGLYNIFYIKLRNDTKYTLLPRGDNAFKKLMSEQFKDDPAIVADLNKEVFSFDNVDALIAKYNNNTNAR